MAFLFYFQCMNFISVNGKILTADQPVLMADNKSYRYGDGLFETMKVIRNKIVLKEYHFERFFSGLELLQFDVPLHITAETLSKEISGLCAANECGELARVRLSAFRGNGGLTGDDTPGFIIECRAAGEEVNQWNKTGLQIDIYPGARKSCDPFSNLKSANYLPYIMAARWARQHRLDDCLVMNSQDRIADATIANVFLVNDNVILTPPLAEGGVNGVMRKYLLAHLQAAGYRVEEQPLTPEQVRDAGELFLTNAIQGIRWVHQCSEKTYRHEQSLKIYNQLVQTIWE